MEPRQFPVTWVKRVAYRRLGWWYVLWFGLSGIGLLAVDDLLLGSGIVWSSITEFWPGYLAVWLFLVLVGWGYSHLAEPGWIGLSSRGVRFDRRGGPLTPWSELVEARRAKLGGVVLQTRRAGALGGGLRVRRLDAAQFRALSHYPLCPDRIRIEQ
jgi:hypothetical protein